MGKDLEDTPFTDLNREQAHKKLAARYSDNAAELDDIMRKLEIPGRMMREMGLPEDQIFAAIVHSTAEALKLDLDNVDHFMVLAAVATYQMRAA